MFKSFDGHASSAAAMGSPRAQQVDSGALLKMVDSVISQHLANPEFETETLVAAIGLPQERLDAQILVSKGMSLGAYLLERRVEHAVAMIRHQHRDLEVSARASGFRTLAAFLAAYDQCCGRLAQEV